MPLSPMLSSLSPISYTHTSLSPYSAGDNVPLQGNLVHDPASILDLVEWNRGMPMPPAVARPKAIAVCGALAPYAKCAASDYRRPCLVNG